MIVLVLELWTALFSSVDKIEDDGKTEDLALSSPDSLPLETGLGVGCDCDASAGTVVVVVDTAPCGYGEGPCVLVVA